ncbi:TerB family tellurite resistance protein [Brevibacillus sp. SYP-B805]|uniref:tellurite resistance TerB family protein n=1 Tax=Brevibacillus sp. SYP-B805 TaxID=1578199 RepID=UPI0013EA1B33|nr:DUF533 domain-containing protein [Brevibacillus sp. SYP-B805]NGQ95398.1 TerB family tellurite resistance protein [Brevibacillus sp. SYP-B805]
MLQASTEKEKRLLFASIRLMICVGHADGYMGEKEVNRIYQLVEGKHFTLQERRILMSDLDDPKSPESIVRGMSMTPTEKLTILRQLYQIALIDRKLSPAEEREIRRIACLLDIPEEKQRQVEEWIYEGISWRNRWEEIVGE